MIFVEQANVSPTTIELRRRVQMRDLERSGRIAPMDWMSPQPTKPTITVRVTEDLMGHIPLTVPALLIPPQPEEPLPPTSHVFCHWRPEMARPPPKAPEFSRSKKDRRPLDPSPSYPRPILPHAIDYVKVDDLRSEDLWKMRQAPPPDPCADPWDLMGEGHKPIMFYRPPEQQHGYSVYPPPSQKMPAPALVAVEERTLSSGSTTSSTSRSSDSGYESMSPKKKRATPYLRPPPTGGKAEHTRGPQEGSGGKSIYKRYTGHSVSGKW